MPACHRNRRPDSAAPPSLARTLTAFWTYSVTTGAAAVVLGQELATALRPLLPPLPTAMVSTVVLVVLAGLLQDRVLAMTDVARTK